MNKIHVLLVDGRRILREGQAVLLEKHADIKVLGEADDASAAPKLVRALSPNVVVLNVSTGMADAGERSAPSSRPAAGRCALSSPRCIPTRRS